MSEDRYLEVSVELKVTIDRNVLQRYGLPENVVKELVEKRVSSLAHRLSAWLTETILSTLMTVGRYSQNTGGGQGDEEDKQVSECQPTQRGNVVARILLRDNKLVFEPLANISAMQYRKYILYKGREVPLVMNTKRIIQLDQMPREVAAWLLGLAEERGHIDLVEAYRRKDNKKRLVLRCLE